MVDHLTADARSRLMSRVRTRDTTPEKLLRGAMWAAGLRGWRLHVSALPGTPDLAFLGLKLAVFVDGAFWHGHPEHYHGQSGPFWDEKIARNRERDRRVDAELSSIGWTVLRLWDFEVEEQPRACVARVQSALDALRTAGRE